MIVISRTPLLYDALENKSGVISPEIQSIKRDIKTGSYDIEIFDRLKVDSGNYKPGEPLYSYNFLRKRVKTYRPDQINQLFDLFGETITKGSGEFDVKFIGSLPEALLFISNTTSIYGSDKKTPEEILSGTPGAFELVDETLEVAPEITA